MDDFIHREDWEELYSQDEVSMGFFTRKSLGKLLDYLDHVERKLRDSRIRNGNKTTEILELKGKIKELQ